MDPQTIRNQKRALLAFPIGSVVSHKGVLYQVLGAKWRSDCLRVAIARSGEEVRPIWWKRLSKSHPLEALAAMESAV